ncbi:GNAT family N-acetyltransferase, partial [Chloroflexota bacterium]
MERNIGLTDGFVTLRPYQTGDIGSLYEAALESIAEAFMWMPWCHADYSIGESKEFIESLPQKWEQGIAYDFVITETINGLYLGGCAVNRFQNDWRLANLGYRVRTSQTKKGVPTTVTLLLAKFAFDELKLNRVEIRIDVDNIASLRVAENAGTVKEGVL